MPHTHSSPSPGFGLASQLGVVAGVPTIGVAKKLLSVDGLTKKDVVKKFESTVLGDEAERRWMPLEGASKKVHGAAVQSTVGTKVSQPQLSIPPAVRTSVPPGFLCFTESHLCFGRTWCDTGDGGASGVVTHKASHTGASAASRPSLTRRPAPTRPAVMPGRQPGDLVMRQSQPI